MDRNKRPSLRRALASLLTGVLVTAGALVGIATPAQAVAAPTLAATATVTPGTGISVSIAGSGYEIAPQYPGQATKHVYVALIESGSDLGDIDTGGATPNTTADVAGDGSIAATLTQTVAGLDRSATYEVIAWPSRSFPTTANVFARAAVTIDWTALFPPAPTTTTVTAAQASPATEGTLVDFTVTVDPAIAAGDVTLSHGSTTVGTVAVASGAALFAGVELPVGETTLTASFAPADPAAYAASSGTSTFTITEVAGPEPVAPAIALSTTSGLDAAGDTLTVTGTGFLPNAPETNGTRPPLAGAFAGAYVVFGYYAGDTWTSAGRTTDYTKWAVAASDVERIGGEAAGAVAIAPDGSFTATLSAVKVDSAPAGARFGVRTYAAGGSTYAAFATFTEVTFATPASAPTLTVTPSTGLDPEGVTITVTGEDYSTEGTAVYGPTAGQPAGVYAQIGWLSDHWRPSESAAASNRTNAYSVWVQGASDTAPYLRWTDNGDGTADFTWSVTIDKATLDAKKLEGGTLSVFTVGAGGGVQAANEKAVAIAFADEAIEPEQPEEPEAPAPAVTVSPATDLDPNVANVLTVSGTGFTGAGAASGAYVLFGETSIWSGGSALPSAGWIAQAWITPGQISGGAFTTTLTIPAGTLDPAKTYQVATSAAHGLSVTDRSLDTFTAVSVAQVEAQPVITLDAASVVQGSRLTVSGSGFPAGQTATATVHSDVIILGTATTSSAGAFTITGTIPADFAPGAHTLTVTVGDVSVSQAITITAAAPAAAPVATCTAQSVAGATISWGVKTSFREYIGGSIANGSYSISWGTGAGAFNTDEGIGRVGFGGAATFTGHGGLLDLTISNPTIQVTGARTAVLSAQVRSAAYGGNPAVDGRVVLATLSLPAASVSGGAIGWSGAAATLTSAGAAAFGGFYEAGTALDPVSFTFPLGAEVPCDVTTSGELAATGGQAPVDILWIGVGMLILGAGAYSLRRRAVRA